MADSDRQVLRILRDAAASILGEDPAKRQQGIESLIGWHGFNREQATRWWDDLVRRGWGGFALINTPPGSGKSRDATEFANVLWEQAGMATLYLMLTHEAIEERIERLKADGRWGQWTRWEPHKNECGITRYSESGYSGGATCTCGRSDRTIAGPTIATLDNILPNLPDSDVPLVLSARAFDLWMVDEIDFQKFVGRKDIGYWDIKAASRDYPNETVKALSRALVSVMDDAQSDKPLSGDPLHDALFDALDREVSDVGQVWNSLKAVELETTPWSSESPPPMNFPVFLVPVLLDEFKRMALNWPFNPRIHVLRNSRASEPVVRVWWRKDLLEAEEGPDVYYLPVTWVFDATADAELLGRCLSMDFLDIEAEDDRQPKWPKNVEVGQWKSDLVTMSTIGIGWHNKPNARERWYRRVLNELEPLQGDHAAHKIGVITHKVIEEELVERIRGAGFQNVVSRHYGDERGSNEMEDAHILVLLGLPIPNIDEFQQEAQAFFYDEATLDFEWSERKEKLQMADGSTTEVSVDGYWQEPVARYFRQKCQSGLYQSLHRIRPYNPQPYDRHILIFTNMPIDGVVVDRLMMGEREATTSNRLDQAADFVLTQLDPFGEVTVKAVVGHLASSDKTKKRSIETWVMRERKRLAEASGTNYMPRVVGGKPARFMIADDGVASESETTA